MSDCMICDHAPQLNEIRYVPAIVNGRYGLLKYRDPLPRMVLIALLNAATPSPRAG